VAALQQNPDLTQRQLAALMGVSLGKANYLQRKTAEYEALRDEIERLKADLWLLRPALFQAQPPTLFEGVRGVMSRSRFGGFDLCWNVGRVACAHERQRRQR